MQAQYHSLKLECEKLASEKTEMQRHYVMYYEMSYGLNIEMHKQAEIVKRLNAICAQVIPFLSQEHQQQVVQAVERAKQVTMAELNAIIGASCSVHLIHAKLHWFKQSNSGFELKVHTTRMECGTRKRIEGAQIISFFVFHIYIFLYECALI